MRLLALIPAVVALALMGCGADAGTSGGPRMHAERDDERGFAVAWPDGWKQADGSLTPGLVDPLELISLGTGPLEPAPLGACGHVPTGALLALGPEDALVSFQERAGRPTREFVARAEPFELGAPTRTDVSECIPGGAHFAEWLITFREGGRAFYAIVAVGERAPPARRAQAERIVASFRAFGPGRLDEPATP